MFTTSFQFVYPYLFLLLIPALLLVLYIKRYWCKGAVYSYSLGAQLQSHGHASKHPHKIILFLLRALIFALLIFVIPMPQMVDVYSKTSMHGIDIVLVLDISGSMQGIDDEKDPRSRIAIAKEEALHFVNKRTNDALGLVLFAREAFSRCPLTLDKKMVRDIIADVQIGLLDPNETCISTALVTAANRLKNSPAKSKIIILLTDGAPSESDLDAQVAIAVAKQLGIKIYTIGVGGYKPYFFVPGLGMVPTQEYDKKLLQEIACETGGHYFKAHDAKDMRSVYDTIDALEKTKYEVDRYTHAHDIFMPFIIAALVLLCFELLFSSLLWFSL